MDDKLTYDLVSGGALEIVQRQHGYRFGLDTLLLATDLPEFDETGRVVELGTGQGVVALCAATRYPEATVVAIERHESLYELLVQNIERNDLIGRVEPLFADIRDFRDVLEPHTATLVLCNPPYFRPGDRRPSSNQERAVARHELHGGLDDFVDAARYVLTQRGRLKINIPPLRLFDLVSAVEGTDMAFESMRYFHSRVDDTAYLVECVLRRGGAPDYQVLPPLYIYKNAEDYTDEVQRRIDTAATQP